MDQALNSRASYGMSFVSILMKNDRVIKGFYCTLIILGVILTLATKVHPYAASEEIDGVYKCLYWLSEQTPGSPLLKGIKLNPSVDK